MTEMPKRLIPDTEVFAATRPPTLAQILRRCEAELTGTALRDTRSAFRFLERQAKVDLAGVSATPDRVRSMLGHLNAASIGVTEKRLANIASAIRKAVEKFGPRRIWITREIELAPAWKELLDRIAEPQARWGLSRFAVYCTVKGIAPEEVSSKILIGFQTALEAESLSKDPVNIRKRAIAAWNRCAKTVQGWPQIRLASPFKPEAYMYPLEAFPLTTQAEIAAFETRMTNPDPLDSDAPIRAFRADTLKSYQYAIRRLVSALVREKGFPIESITSLAVLFESNNLRDALRPFVKPGDGAKQDYAYKMATQMRSIAKYFLKLPADQIEKIDRIVDRLKPHLSTGMGKSNFRRLGQFDDESTVGRLLNLPGQQLALALRNKSALRRAKGVERALMLAICIFARLRAKNLRQLRLDRNIRPVGNRLFIELFEDETKTHADHTIELPEEVAELLDLFVADHRSALPGSTGPYLFPAPNGGARSYSAIRNAVGVKVRKLAGIDINPHLYRHAIAKIVFERRPELIFDISRTLGHRSVNPTYGHYLGSEVQAASRRVNALLQDVRNDGEADAGKMLKKETRT